MSEAFLAALRAQLPELRLLTDDIDRESYRRDETAHHEPGLPLAVALPATTAEVSAIMRLATEHRVPVVPRGAGSGLSGGSAGVAGALTVVMTRMNAIVEIDRDNLCVVTQPGVINAELKNAVAAEGLFYAPDPASYEICSIGGNIGTNAGGLCCVKYGVTRDAVLGLEVVLADGRVIRTGGRNVKDVAGYSLTHLIVGSQGTLGIVTEAILRLRPAPPAQGDDARLLRHDRGRRRGGGRHDPCRDRALHPGAHGPRHHRRGRRLAQPRPRPGRRCAAAHRVRPARCRRRAEELARAEACCAESGATDVHRATDPMEADYLRQVRRMAFRAMERLGVARMEDVGAPRSRMPELLLAIERVATAHNVRCGTFGHAGDGNLHPTFVWDRDDHDAEERAHAACEELYRAAIALGGTVTGEHGIGAARRPFLEEQRGADAVDVMRAIKTALDPLGILNPGKVV